MVEELVAKVSQLDLLGEKGSILRDDNPNIQNGNCVLRAIRLPALDPLSQRTCVALKMNTSITFVT